MMFQLELGSSDMLPRPPSPTYGGGGGGGGGMFQMSVAAQQQQQQQQTYSQSYQHMQQYPQGVPRAMLDEGRAQPFSSLAMSGIYSGPLAQQPPMLYPMEELSSPDNGMFIGDEVDDDLMVGIAEMEMGFNTPGPFDYTTMSSRGQSPMATSDADIEEVLGAHFSLPKLDQIMVRAPLPPIDNVAGQSRGGTPEGRLRRADGARGSGGSMDSLTDPMDLLSHVQSSVMPALPGSNLDPLSPSKPKKSKGRSPSCSSSDTSGGGSASSSSSSSKGGGLFGRSWNPLKFNKSSRGSQDTGRTAVITALPLSGSSGARRNDSLVGGNAGKRKMKIFKGKSSSSSSSSSSSPTTDLLLGRDLSNAADSQIMAGIQSANPEQPAGRNLFGRAKRHRCRFCSKGFVTPSKLQRHERIHTGDKPFGCDCCSQRFTQRCGLKVHTHLHARELMVAPGIPTETKLAMEINGFVVSELVQAMQRTSDARSVRPTPLGGATASTTEA